MNTPGSLYIPYKISIADVIYAMRSELPFGFDIDMSIVMLELLRSVFFDHVGRYGKYEGVVGAYRVLIPQEITDQEAFEIDVQMHDYESQVSDVIAGYFPQMSMQPHNHYFYYPPGMETDLVIYAPVTEDLPPTLSAKALPEQAIRNSVR